MSISFPDRQKIRERADFACEYCGVSETDSGGELTIDHYRPTSKNGGNEQENLVYCCFRCNLYKGDCFPDQPEQTRLFNPRTDNRAEHFWLSASGKLYALTESGEFTIKLLRLNRQPLVTKRRRTYQRLEEQILLEQTRKAADALLQLSRQQRELLEEQRNLLEEQRRLIDVLLRK